MGTQIARSTNTTFEDILQRKFYSLDSLKRIAKDAAQSEGFKIWLDTEEGVEILTAHRRYLDHYLDATCTRVIDKSLELLLDRLEFGDICRTPEGDTYREEISALSLSKIFASVFDRRQLIRKKPTMIAFEEDSLEKIADVLTNLAANKPNMVSVQVVNVSPGEIEREDDV